MALHSFKPAWWLPQGDLQTIWPALFKWRRYKHLSIERERIELPDKDFIDIDWSMPQANNKPLVLLLHGFEGSVDSHYAKGMMAAIVQRGWRAGFIHFRGCSGEANRLARGYHAGDTEDLNYCVNLIKSREPDIKLAMIGFSLGGNVLLKWLGETGNHNCLVAAVAISVPYDLHKSVTHIQKGFSRIYQWYLLNCIKLRLNKKFALSKFSSLIDYSAIAKLATIYDLDNNITAPLHGFANANAYYVASSSRQYLIKIKIPTLLLHAQDDPLMTLDAIPTPEELSSYIELELTSKGGHVGFVSGILPWLPRYWLEERVPDFLEQYF